MFTRIFVALTLLVFITLSPLTHAYTSGQVKVHNLITNKTTTGATDAAQPLGLHRTFHGFGNVTASTGAAEIEVQVSNDGTNWIIADTLALVLGTTVTSDSYENLYAWKYVRGSVKSISGTNAKVSLIMGAQL